MFSSIRKVVQKGQQVIGDLMPDGSVKIAAAGVVTTIGASAHAAIPTNVQTALDSLSADALTVAGIVLAAVVAVYAFKFIRKGL